MKIRKAEPFASPTTGGLATGDIQIRNALGMQAIDLGSDDFDVRTAAPAEPVSGGAAGGIFGADIAEAACPCLATTLDVASEINLGPLAAANGPAHRLAPKRRSSAGWRR